nr:glycosyltransferase [Brachybacterium kimchii]
MSPGIQLHAPSIDRRVRHLALSGSGQPRRVLHFITNSLPHTQSGYSLRTHRILSSMSEAGIDSVALTRTGYPVMVGKFWAKDEDLVDGIRYTRCLPGRLGETPESRLEQEVARAMELVDEFDPHVLHATTDYRNALVAQAVSAETGIPWVFEVRGLMEQTWIASHRTPTSREAASASQKASLVSAREGELAAQAGAVITLSQTMADELERRGVDAGVITVVPNGVEKSLLDQDLTPQGARNRLGLDVPPDAFVVGAVSALVPYEGHDVLLHAVSEILHSSHVSQVVRDRLHVVIAGDGTAAPSLIALAAELGIQDRVIMPGRVPREEAKFWVQALDVVVVPRLDLDVSRAVTPQKPVEAMALGRPVVVSDLPALRECVTNSRGQICATLAPAGDPSGLAQAIVDLADSDRRRAALADRAHQLASERTWLSMVRRYVAAYDRAQWECREGAVGGD